MISLLTTMIQEHPEWLRSPGTPLSFMKTSTPASGTRADQGKVLLFIFEEREIWPTLCVKTTRTYAGGAVIRENHTNLKLLGEGVRESAYAKLFARPLYLYDDGSLIFSIESVCPGIKFSASVHNIESVVEKYIGWQLHLAQKTKEFQVFENNVRLPKILQHGDMTPDNVLVSGENVYLIDYDYVGMSSLPGFDLLNFLSKLKLHPEVWRLNCERYFPRYFRSIGIEVSSYKSLLPLYYEEEAKRKDGKI